MTGERDVRIAETNQLSDDLRRMLPAPMDQDALTLMRDFKRRPGEMAEFVSGSHEAFRGMDPEERAAALADIRKLEPTIARAQNPTPAMKQADSALTDYYTAHLKEGKELGFLDSKLNNDEYITHIGLGQAQDVERPGLIQRMLAREGRYKELGLTPQEARDTAADYVRRLRRGNGKGTTDVHEFANRIFDAQRGNKGATSDGLGPAGGEPQVRAPGPDAGRGGRGGLTARARQGVSGDGGDAASARVGASPAHSAGEGLFSSDAESQSRADATSAADKLLGDRLTAQVKSGGAVKPANLKPATNRGLFDEEGPEQGRLFSKRIARDESKEAVQKALADQSDKDFGAKLRTLLSIRSPPCRRGRRRILPCDSATGIRQ